MNDPELGIQWPVDNPTLSAQDEVETTSTNNK